MACCYRIFLHHFARYPKRNILFKYARWSNERVLWDSKIRLGEDFFNEIISHPVPLNMNTLTALKRSPLGLDLYLWLTYRTFTLRASQRLSWGEPLPAIWDDAGQGQRQPYRSEFP